MLVWVLCISIVILSPLMFPEQFLTVIKVLLKWTRITYAKMFGYDQMIDRMGYFEWWEHRIDDVEFKDKKKK
jgi:hypothetical protein